MKYTLKEIPSYQDLTELTETVLQEDANMDNKFYLIQTVYGDLGFTYYHLGIKPCIILKNDVFFMGFGSSIMIYDIFRKELLYKITDAMHIVYDLQYNAIFDNIVVICELCVLAFSCEGQLLWETGFRDWIFDYSIEDRMIEIRFEDAIVLSLSIKDGRATRATK